LQLARADANSNAFPNAFPHTLTNSDADANTITGTKPAVSFTFSCASIMF